MRAPREAEMPLDHRNRSWSILSSSLDASPERSRGGIELQPWYMSRSWSILLSRTLSETEGHPGSNACGGRMRYAPSMLYSKFFLDYLPLWLFFLSLSLALGQRLPG